MRRLTAIVLLCVCASVAYAQNTGGELKGKILDKGNNEPLPFVNMVLESNGTQVAGGSTDFDGKFTLKPIPPGKYDLKVSYVGYKPKMITGIQINVNKISFQDVLLESSAIAIEEFEVIEYTVPLIDKDGGASGQTVTREDIEKMPGRSALSIATTVGGVFSEEGSSDVNIRGSRSDGTYYYIDGIKVRGSSGLPKSAIEQVSVITGGLPANYGDATGGIISVTTRGASSFYFGGLEILTSGFGPELGLGLDPYGYRLIEGSLSGPLWMKKDEEGKETTPLLGFFVAGNYTNVYDSRPFFDGTFKVKEEVRNELIEKPFREIEGQSVAIYNTDFLTGDDFEKLEARENVKRQGFQLQGKIDVNLGTSMNLTFGGSADYAKNHGYSFVNTLFNADNNTQNTSLSWRAYTKFTQRFNANPQDEQSNSSIKNAFYTVMVDYSKNKNTSMDDTHLDNLFGYGYVGKFNTYKIPSYAYNPATFTLEHNGWRDTLVRFTPSEQNSEMAAITTQYFQLFDETDEHYENLTQIEQGKGLLNGDLPEGVYGLWNNIGRQTNTYSLSDASQFRVTASGSADVGDHAISLGFEYEQRTDRAFSASPVGLWSRAELLVNNHILEIDTSSLYIDDAGTFKRATYSRLNAAPGAFDGEDAQYYIDYRLREKLGLDPDGLDWVDVFSIDPEVFSLDMFSADELLNDGNNVVSYYGYDHTGKKLKSKPSFDDFFKDVDEENGNIKTRLIPAFEPIYISGYIMDKFAFDDIIFNIGVRVDRFDANQMVPKDQYSLHETISASEDEALDLLPEGQDAHPNDFGEDYVVYVNNLEDPTQITGYRNTTDNSWFNADGEEINDPSVIESANGVAPLLVNKDRSALPNEKAFEDYTPQVVFMPRISFSFPISDEATFFAHYDKLSQRPTSSNRLDPIGYYFLQNVRRTLSNPNLKPQKTTEYELGFQQVLTKSSSLKISTFYREQRDMIQAQRLFSAYPADYTTYGNIDFGTVKGMTVTYDLRRTGNVWMKVSYTLQFAEGTGSGSNTGLNLANTGQPNLVILSPYNFDQRHAIVGTIDYRYGSGTDYNGPILFNKPIFENTGLNLVTNVGSGLPYSRSENIFITTSPNNGNLVGTINGSNLPWTLRSDVQIDRDFPLTFGKEKEDGKRKNAMLNVYFQINNVFNIRNITNVHRATGNPDDDGYLNAAQFQPVIEQQRNEESYRMYYAMRVNNPANWGLPRTIRLGMRLGF